MRLLRRALFAVAAIVIAGMAAGLVFGPGYVERGRNAIVAHAPYPIPAATRSFHQSLTVVDWHADTLMWNRDLLDRGARGHVDLPRLREGGVALQGFFVPTKSPAGYNYDRTEAGGIDNIQLLAILQLWPPRTWTSLLQRALYMSERLHRAAAASGGTLRVITSRSDLERLLADRAAGADVVGGFLGLEGAHALENGLDDLDRLQAAGFRVIGLHHFFDNDLGGSLHGVSDAGLSAFGRDLVQAIAARDLVLDLAHSSPAVVREVLDLTDMPVLVSHTGLHGHCSVKRNIVDDLMREVAATGGVVAIGFWTDVVCGDGLMDVAHAIATAVEVLGEDHVALGSDFDGATTTPFDASEYAALTDALRLLKLSDQAIAKVMGENSLRVLRQRLPE